MQRNRKLQTTLNVRGRLIEAVTISGLARMVGKSRNTLLRYERMQVFPPAPLINGKYRYYPVSLAKRLVPLVDRLPINRKPDESLIVQINQVFKEEKDKLCQNQHLKKTP